jgi:hypothetical protein
MENQKTFTPTTIKKNSISRVMILQNYISAENCFLLNIRD